MLSAHLGDVGAAVGDGLGELGGGDLEGLAGEGGGRRAEGEELGQQLLQLRGLEGGGSQAARHGLHAVDGLRGLGGEHSLSPVVAAGDVGVLDLLLGPQSVVQHLLEGSLGVGVDDWGVADLRGPKVPHVNQLDTGHTGKQEVVDVGGEGDGVGHGDVCRGVVIRGLKVVIVSVTIIFLSLKKTFSLFVLIGVKLVEVPHNLWVVIPVRSLILWL